MKVQSNEKVKSSRQEDIILKKHLNKSLKHGGVTLYIDL